MIVELELRLEGFCFVAGGLGEARGGGFGGVKYAHPGVEEGRTPNLVLSLHYDLRRS